MEKFECITQYRRITVTCALYKTDRLMLYADR